MFEIAATICLIFLGLFFGRYFEKKHFKSILRREKKYSKILSHSLKKPTHPEADILKSRLVIGSTVISIDYFKQFMAGLKLLVGGRLTSYESLLDRARREAILRMKAQARGYNSIINIRIETSTIHKGHRNNQSMRVGSIEILAYGTAIKTKHPKV